ncbi:MAG: hypothetical protein JWR72_3856 [Flavisolibacter sp.]|nr:hypothetical protein [Flavisolibacter sp.]
MNCVLLDMNWKALAIGLITFEQNKLSPLYRAILLTAFLLSACTIWGQSLSTYSFTHYGMVNGLASNEVFSVVQDRAGYLWIATNNGLQRFDGIHYKTFRHQRKNIKSLPSNVIIKLLVDAKDNLWIITNSGDIGIFDKDRFLYKNVPVIVQHPGVAEGGERRFITDEYGNLFLSIRGGEVLRFDERKGQFVSIYSFIPLKKEWGITSLSQQPGTQKYWLGLQSGGLVIYNKKTGNLSYTGHNIEAEPAIEVCGPKSDFAYSFFDRQGRVWFHQWGGGFPYCVQYDPNRKENPLQKFEFITTLRTYNELRGFTQLSDGRIGVYGVKIMAFFNESENRFEIIPNDFRNEQGIVYESLTGLFEDREKNIWVGTQENGLYRFNPSRQFFTNVPHTSRSKGGIGDGSVMSFIETKNGDLLTGTWEDGPFRYTSNLKNIRTGFRDSAKVGVPYLWSLCASADSNIIWMGSQPGLYTYDQSKNTVLFRNPPQLQNRTVRQVVEDKSGNLWLGMHGFGLFRWFNPKDRNKDSVLKVTETGNAMANRLMIDKQNVVWLGTGNDGLFAFDGSSGRLLRRWKTGTGIEGNMIGNSVMALLEYNDSLTLIGTLGDLFFYSRNTNRLSALRLPDALMGNISSLEKDDEGFIWIGTTNALYRWHPKIRTLVLFNRQDGISNDRFGLSASYKMKDGRLLFGNSNSFICFNPKDIRLNDVAAPVVFTGIEVGKTELRVDSVIALDELVVGYKDNSLNITFSPLIFSTSSLIQYKMEGIDDEWKIADKDNRASFPFLPSRRYTLLLRTLNAEGVPFEKPTILHIRIKPPFWQTWWFYTLLAIGVATLLYRFDRQRMKRKEGLQRVRTDIAAGLHQEINTALNNINILSEIARLKSDKEPQKSKEYLEQIHTKSHNMIIAMDDMLWSLDPENDSMSKTISRIKEFTDALTQRHGVIIELLIDKKVEKLELDMKMRHEAFLLFKEGLRSLVEAGTGRCIVHLAVEKAKLLFTIEFENEGCSMQQLNNLLHRRDIEARLHALGAKLDVQLHKSRSIFLLQLPLGIKG